MSTTASDVQRRARAGGAARRIAFQPYLMRFDLAGDWRAMTTSLADAGYDALEPYDLSTTLDAVLPVMDALPVVTAHDRLVGRDLAPVLDAARQVGATTLFEPFVEPARWVDEEAVRALADEYLAAAAVAADAGVAVGHHNHDFEVRSTIRGATALEVFADLVGARVPLQLDVFWIEVAGRSSVDLLGRLGDRVTSLHLKDGTVVGVPEQMPLGVGSMPIREILAAAPAAHLVVAPDTTSDDPVQDAVDSVRSLRSMLEEGR